MMTEEQFDKLLELIAAAISEHAAKDSSDGGLIEAVNRAEVEREARALFVVV